MTDNEVREGIIALLRQLPNDATRDRVLHICKEAVAEVFL